MRERSAEAAESGWTAAVGLDLGDRRSHFCVVSRNEGGILEEGTIPTTVEAFRAKFGPAPRLRMAIEVGTHSPWVSRVLEGNGHEVFVSDVAAAHGPRRRRKNDRRDARGLALQVRSDPRLLAPMRHRSETTQTHRAMLIARDGLVRVRTELINRTRGLVKALAGRLPQCSSESFAAKAAGAVPESLRVALAPLLATIADVTSRIRDCDREIDALCRERYPETEGLRRIVGVGPLTSLAYVLTIEDPGRFARSRTVGAYLGLVPGQQASGERDPQCRISKAGDELLRRLLVTSAHYILGPFGPDCDLRRFGERIARGGKNAKKRAVVAVARKLAVLMHRLWSRGETYEPLHNALNV